MQRPLFESPLRAIALSALALAGSMLAQAPALASPAASYAVRLAQPLSGPKQAIIGEVLWKCADDRCTAADAGSRPLVMCQRVAHKFGEVAEFRSAAGDLAAAELAKCNAR